MIFGRNRDVKIEQVTLPEHLRDAEEDTVDENKTHGPWDVSEKDVPEAHLDLEVLKLPIVPDVKVRLDLEESTKSVIGVTLIHENSTLQIQTFAAPRSGGLWDEVRQEVTESLEKTNGATVTENEGEYGTELLAKIPAKMPDGRPGWRVARFLGVDGRRWFVRAVVGGPAVLDKEKAGPLLEAFSGLIVDRGKKPYPSRQILRLSQPKNARRVKRKRPTVATEKTDSAEQAPVNDQGMPERGPEITEVR